MKKGSTDEGLVYHAGFPNAGEDQHGQSLSLDALVVKHRASTYFWRLEHDVPQMYWQAGSVVVVDRTLVAKTGRLCVVVADSEFVIARMQRTQFQDLDGHTLDESVQLWGVITHCLQGYA